MSDEIDIEEHDVMDNPSIKRIFPDLSVIKQEINQYFDEAPDITSEATFEELKQDTEVVIDTKTHKQSDIEICSDNGINTEVTDTPKESKYFPENIIILGSKPSAKKNHGVKKPEPRVKLQNISSFLNGCKRYCKDCHILFPKANFLNLHKFVVHTAQKRLTLNETKHMGRQLSEKLYECSKCHNTLSSRGNLMRHFKNIHGYIDKKVRKPKTLNTLSKLNVSRNNNKVISSENIISTSVENIKTMSSENINTGVAPGHSCFHCQQLFPSQSSLIEHLYSVLAPKSTGVGNCTTSPTSAIETNKVDTFDQYAREKNSDESLNTKCNKCGIEFKSQIKFNKHNCDTFEPETTPNKNNLNTENILQRRNIPKRKNTNGMSKIAKYDKETKYLEQEQVNNRTKYCEDEKCIGGSKTRNINKYNKPEHVNSKDNSDTPSDISDHKEQKHLIKENKVISKMKNLSLKKSQGQLSRTLYRCHVCSKYTITYKFYKRHLNTDHRIKPVGEVKKVLFNSKCKFCSSNMSGMKSYNVHLRRYHNMLLKKNMADKNISLVNRIIKEKFNEEFNFALKSILYKCMKCEMFFLSANAAICHSEHIETTNNWTCSVCQRLFKNKDKALHLKQHSFSQTLTVYTLSESAFSRVLYKCSKCTVHYGIDNFLLHYSKCDSEVPNSLYCKVCDILINADDMGFHEINHKNNNMQYCDFTIIESDVIESRSTNPNKVKRKNMLKINRRNETIKSLQDHSNLVLFFCPTCKCFVSNINLTRNVHTEGRCGHMLKTVCKECGLVLTMKTHSTTHKNQHKHKLIKLQDYLFYDLKTRQQICPPIPDYPCCNMCGVHFLRKNAIQKHECQQQDYITCNVCSIKLTERAHKLHIQYHNYSILKPKAELHTEPTCINNLALKNFKSRISVKSITENVLLLYTCKSCQITVNTYDSVVQHCQDHYDCKENKINSQKCKSCNLLFDTNDYETHNKLHLNEKYNKDSTTIIDFDPFYLRFKNDFWKNHIFAYVSDEQIRKILDSSIYKHECRLKMQVLQSGSSNMILYKCHKCRVFVEPHSLFIHAENSNSRPCIKLTKHPCAFCGLTFVSLSYRMEHEKEHGNKPINLLSYKIISFNKIEHEIFNKIMYDACNRYILYQCRNCSAVVDKFQRGHHQCDMNNLKACSTCGLNFPKQDYDLHFIRHEELDRFITEHIVVVKFGKEKGKKKLTSTFSGTIYDYRIYKCRNCDLCLQTKACTNDHVCIFDDNSKRKCLKCGLYFSTLEFKYHSKMHETHLEFSDININIITFDNSTNLIVDPEETLEVKNESLKATEEPNKNIIVNDNTNNSTPKLETIYKCGCGLHFLEEPNAQQHANNCNVRMKISKQNCFKCDLLFTPGELFNHLLKHHCDKKLQYKFDIIIVNKKVNS